MAPARPIPHTASPLWPAAIGPMRFAASVERDSPAGCRVAFLGIPDDLGIRLNAGRPGAAGGPRAVREALARYGVSDPSGWAWPGVFDAGDVTPAEGGSEAALRETHKRVTEATAALLDHGLFPIAIGGGHDLTFPFVRAVSARAGGRSMAGVYFDPHLDVRETAGSGMGMRRLVEECRVGPLANIGFSPLVNSREHHAWFLSRGGMIRAMPDGPWPELGAPQFVSMDMDAIDASQAPGVSALNPAGFSVAEVARSLESAGRSSDVACFDLMELNPAYDPDGRTARAAAHLLLSFLRGFSERPS